MIDSENIKEIAYNYETKNMEIYLVNPILHNRRNTKIVLIKTNEKYFIQFCQEWIDSKKK